MSAPLIRVQNLGKRYTLRQGASERYTALRDVIARGFKRMLSPAAIRREQTQESFWALQDVSFDLQAGEVLGIIGRNGAGKSTLLKILSRITEPTTGRITMRGRVASLLEVGTGFHPELSGRENVFLNGAILGMKRDEIKARFDEIIAFAEVERFLDTPIKHYSSGMHMRLAFAVAAHLDPEILVIDEVLAVGDAAFQDKCLGKMKNLAQQQGRTVIFVSHHLGVIRQLTHRCIVLDKGKVAYMGSAATSVAHYLAATRQPSTDDTDVSHLARALGGTGQARFVNLTLAEGRQAWPEEGELLVLASIQCAESTPPVRACLTLHTEDGTPVCSGFSAAVLELEPANQQTVVLRVHLAFLTPGRYHCTIALSCPQGAGEVLLDALSSVLPFEIVSDKQRQHEPVGWHRNWGAARLPELEVQLGA